MALVAARSASGTATVVSQMYRFLLRPRWLAFHLLVIAAVALMVWLGFWQLRRLDERRDFNATVTERMDETPVPLDELLDADADDLDAIEWRQVTLDGSWLPDQVIWYNRSQGGLAGDNVLTALMAADGTTVVVNRGFVPIGTEIPAPPDGDVEALGRVRLPQGRQLGELTDNADGPVSEVRRIDLDQLGQQLPGVVAPVYVDLIATAPPVTDADPVPTPAPELDEGPHLSYAIQWFIFAACVAIGWVLAVRRSIATRRQVADGDVAPPDGADLGPTNSSAPGETERVTSATNGRAASDRPTAGDDGVATTPP